VFRSALVVGSLVVLALVMGMLAMRTFSAYRLDLGGVRHAAEAGELVATLR
jgi:hypothetical protein